MEKWEQLRKALPLGYFNTTETYRPLVAYLQAISIIRIVIGSSAQEN